MKFYYTRKVLRASLIVLAAIVLSWMGLLAGSAISTIASATHTNVMVYIVGEAVALLIFVLAGNMYVSRNKE